MIPTDPEIAFHRQCRTEAGRFFNAFNAAQTKSKGLGTSPRPIIGR
jgi:hypothetical protein